MRSHYNVMIRRCGDIKTNLKQKNARS
jgi:hypothetical protein